MAEHREHYRVTATDETQRALASVKRGFSEVEGAISSVARATAGLAGIAAAALTVGQFARAASEAETASNRLTAVIAAQGGAAGRTKQQLDAMAESMAGSTIFDDDDIRNAQATLLKFGNIHGEVFDRAMIAVANYASYTGSSMQDAAQVYGKALQAPTEGTRALEAQLGRLTTTQDSNIKAFVEQGRVVNAQVLVLDIFDKKLGNSAALINSGITKELADLKKNIGETFEALGKTGAVDTGLKVINSALKDIRETVESGDWMSLLGDLFIIGRPIMGTPKIKQDPTKSSGIIGGGPADPRLTGRLAEINAQIEAARNRQAAKKTGGSAGASKEMSLDELLAKGAIKRLETQEQAERDAEASAAALRKEQDKLRESVIDLIDPTAQTVRLLEAYSKAAEEGIITTEQYAEAYGILTDKMHGVVTDNDAIRDGLEKNDGLARDLGFTFSSAFEDAIVQGGELRDVVRGLGMDMARIVMRKTVTEPLGNAFAGLIGQGIGSLFGSTPQPQLLNSFAGGGYTGDGARSGGLDGQGGFMAMLHPRETVTDLTRGAGGSGGNVYHIDARGADMGAAARIERALLQLAGPGVVERRAVAAVSDYRIRTGA